jgi:hypothetical protein
MGCMPSSTAWQELFRARYIHFVQSVLGVSMTARNGIRIEAGVDFPPKSACLSRNLSSYEVSARLASELGYNKPWVTLLLISSRNNSAHSDLSPRLQPRSRRAIHLNFYSINSPCLLLKKLLFPLTSWSGLSSHWGCCRGLGQWRSVEDSVCERRNKISSGIRPSFSLGPLCTRNRLFPIRALKRTNNFRGRQALDCLTSTSWRHWEKKIANPARQRYAHNGIYSLGPSNMLC